MLLLTERAQFLVDNLDLPLAAQFEGALWEHFQLAQLQDGSIFRVENKARQIAWSFLAAAEATATGILSGESSFFVSINQKEASEKIRYARNVMDALPAHMRPKLLTDNKLELEFENGARLVSLPATPPRGLAQFHGYLDEFAHTRRDREIYRAAVPIISKGNRRLRIGSSPMGASGQFWEIDSESLQKYPGYTHKKTPWWEVQAFCVNVRLGRKLAPGLSTSARVEMFGNDRIRAIYANMLEEDFQQEYECAYIDESTSWITWDEIRAVQDAALVCASSVGSRRIDEALAAVDALRDMMDEGQVESVFAGGVDIGRTRNATEIFLVGVGTTTSYPLRLMITLDNCEFDAQETVINRVLDRLPVIAMLIDRNGIGRNLAENAERNYPGKAQGVDFTNATKALWAGDAKMLIQQQRTPLPAERDLAYQIHSIRRLITPSKNLIFDTDRNEKHHADKFWAWVLALYAALPGRAQVSTLAAAQLLQCRREYAHGPVADINAYMGVSVGATLYVVIRAAADASGEYRQLYAGEVVSFSDLTPLMAQYHVKACVVGAEADLQAARLFQQRQRVGLVWLAEYAPNGLDTPEPARWDYKNRLVTADRTRTLDELYSRFRAGKNTLPDHYAAIPDYQRHLLSLVRTQEPRGAARVLTTVYIQKEDVHFAHAENYCCLAMKARRGVFLQ